MSINYISQTNAKVNRALYVRKKMRTYNARPVFAKNNKTKTKKKNKTKNKTNEKKKQNKAKTNNYDADLRPIAKRTGRRLNPHRSTGSLGSAWHKRPRQWPAKRTSSRKWSARHTRPRQQTSSRASPCRRSTRPKGCVQTPSNSQKKGTPPSIDIGNLQCSAKSLSQTLSR